MGRLLFCGRRAFGPQAGLTAWDAEGRAPLPHHRFPIPTQPAARPNGHVLDKGGKSSCHWCLQWQTRGLSLAQGGKLGGEDTQAPAEGPGRVTDPAARSQPSPRPSPSYCSLAYEFPRLSFITLLVVLFSFLSPLFLSHSGFNFSVL